MKKYFWLFKYAFLVLVVLAFSVLGVNLLISAYSLNDAHLFVMMFFSSSFIILVCVAFVVGLISRAVQRARHDKKKDLSNSVDSFPNA